MFKALVSFSNGETLELHDGQLIVPISRFTHEDEISVSQCETFKLWYHSSAGMVPSIAELLVKHDFFYLLDNSDKIYKTSAVVSIENL